MAEMLASRGAVLRNESLELSIDPHTGALRAVFDFHSRAPRLAQQVAMRLPGTTDAEDAYSIMAADEIRVLAAGPVTGEVVVRGRLVDRSGQLLAGFQQTTRVTWGSRVIEVEIVLDPQRQLDADPWNSYYAARFAWGQDAPSLYRSMNQAVVATEARNWNHRTSIERSAAARRDARRSSRPACPIIVASACGNSIRCCSYGGRLPGDSAWASASTCRSRWPRPWILQPLRRRSRLLCGPRTIPDGFSISIRGRSSPRIGKRSSRPAAWPPKLAWWDGARGCWRPTGMRLRCTCGRSARSARHRSPAAPIVRPTDLAVEGDRVTVPLRPYEWAEVEGRF